MYICTWCKLFWFSHWCFPSGCLLFRPMWNSLLWSTRPTRVGCCANYCCSNQWLCSGGFGEDLGRGCHTQTLTLHISTLWSAPARDLFLRAESTASLLWLLYGNSALCGRDRCGGLPGGIPSERPHALWNLCHSLQLSFFPSLDCCAWMLVPLLWWHAHFREPLGRSLLFLLVHSHLLPWRCRQASSNQSTCMLHLQAKPLGMTNRLISSSGPGTTGLWELLHV